MEQITPEAPVKWSMGQKTAFRFFCIYFLLNIEPWTWLGYKIPGLSNLTEFYSGMMEWIRLRFNNVFLHFPVTKVVNNGSGDTSVSWEYLFLYLTLSVVGTMIWSLLDRKRPNYQKANYWLRTIIRYQLIITCFIYGWIKIFALQMIFPGVSQLATPLGDLLPMRFSWLFIGYSTPYQVFSGSMELLAGLLLLNRKTVTLGVLTATAVFINVMVLNLCYDIPVKIYSMHLVFYCIYLLCNDGRRLIHFLVLNKTTAPNQLYHIHLPKKWMRITRVLLKIVFLWFFVAGPFINTYQRYRSFNTPNPLPKPIMGNIYDVTVFAVNHDTIPCLTTDSVRWRDVIFENNSFGSVGTTDTAFRQRYRRGYFNLAVDTARQNISFSKTDNSGPRVFASFRYDTPDSSTIRLWGHKQKDSLYVVLKKSNRHFQLAEKQFHWISEANR
jgi:hypothetical protein